MGQELVPVDDRQHDGKFMAALPAQYRQFVIELMELGVSKEAAKEAAELVGFHPYSGYRLLRDQRILDAIHEESSKKLVGGALIGVKRLIEIAQDEKHKDSYKASKDLAAMNGFNPDQRIVVEHISPDSKGMITEIRNMAAQLGLDPKQLISAAGIVEAEFTEVPLDSEGPIDLTPEDTEMDPIEDGDE